MRGNTKGKNNQQWTEHVKNNFSYEVVLFEHMLRINACVTLPDFKRCIDLLEVMFSPYINDAYRKTIDKAFDNFRADLDKYGGKNIPQNVIWTKEWILIKAKYSALMSLAYSCRLIPQYEMAEKVIGVGVGD